MAALNPARALQEELFCPICLDYFTEPVILNCEHNFCRACISTYWENLDDSFPCPQCRKRCHKGKLRPNAQLGKVAEKAKELAARDLLKTPTPTPKTHKPESAPRKEMCKQHLEALKLFCKDDKALICVVCDKSKEHRFHMVIPVEEAVEEYKGQFQHHLATLKNERDSREILAVNQGKRLKMLVGRAEVEHQQTARVFQELRKTLQDRESYILQGLSKVTNDLKQMQQVNESRIQQGAPLLRRGRHHWSVDVRGRCGWALGVAQESVDRKKPVVLQPECGIWAVELGPYQLFPAAPASKEEMEIPTRKVLVSLDYEGGQLTFSDSKDPEPLFTFRTSFTEKLYPFFWLWSPEASITLCS
ncbi:hypothetical protein JD844_013422 [Phrynosoma platyrhinos]|uniref:Uncharacterized protein n=1 Tax=Phrynosoma platyrhinos TaxID=52577 RepID=A0ABQ7TLS7_PHRPL|nr:hypothetical protein JD844_013422 [Phrynosoma platyrhinos]